MAPKKAKKKEDKTRKPEEPEVEPERPDGPKTYFVGGWSTLTSVNEALKLAQEEDTIMIAAGVEVDERVILEKQAAIVGQGEDDRPVLKMGLTSTAGTASLSNLVIHSGLAVEKGSIVVEKCHFANGTNLLTIYPHCSPSILSCSFVGADKACVYCFPYSKGVVEKCTLRGNGAEGTCGVLSDNGGTRFTGNIIEGHSTGVYVTSHPDDTQSVQQATFIGNELLNNVGCALHLDNRSDCIFKKNCIQGTSYWGITISGQAKGKLQDNEVEDKVRICAGSFPEMSRNKIMSRVFNENDQGAKALEPRY